MKPLLSYRQFVFAGLAVLALTGLAGCALDKEGAVRAQIGDWVKLGDTHYFYSTVDCTAGVFEVKGRRITSLISKTRSIATGVRLLESGKAVAFEADGQSPNDVADQIMSNNRLQGIGVLSSGVSGKTCMNKPVKDAYLQALLEPSSVLIFDPIGSVMAVLDRSNNQLFFSRGRE